MSGRGEATGSSRLGLGSVQFGMDYGATNAAGKVPPDTVAEILDFASGRGVRVLDTAFLYGDSETVIGNSGRQSVFNIVTKTDKVSDEAGPSAAATRIERGFARSLRQLGVEQVYGLLVHDPKDLLGPYGDAIWDCLRDIRRAGRASRIGVSVYEGDEIDLILDRFDIDLIQAPFNALDQRLVDGGQLAALAARRVEVHARTIFLQGVLLQPPDRLPQKLAGLRPVVGAMRESFAAAGLTVMEGLLASVLRHTEIHHLIVGTTSLRDLQEILAATERVETLARSFNPARWEAVEPRLINPAFWSNLSDQERLR